MGATDKPSYAVLILRFFRGFCRRGHADDVDGVKECDHGNEVEKFDGVDGGLGGFGAVSEGSEGDGNGDFFEVGADDRGVG